MNKRKQQENTDTNDCGNNDDYEIKRFQCVSSCLASINTTDRLAINK